MWSSTCSLRSVSTLTKRRDFFKCTKCDFKHITTYNLQINKFSVVIIFLLHNIDMSTCSDKKDFNILFVLLCSLVEQYCDMCSCLFFLVITSPQAQECVFESRPVGTTRGDGIKENMSDKHNQQPLMTPFIWLSAIQKEWAGLQEQLWKQQIIPFGTKIWLWWWIQGVNNLSLMDLHSFVKHC